MKKEKIKPLPCIKAFTNYIMHRGKKVLKLKNEDFDHASIDVHPDSKTIWVWFHGSEKIIGRAQFNFDGSCYDKLNDQKETTTTLVTETATQGKPEDA